MGLGIETCDSIEVIIKVTERCNIDCTYCYMFNKGNKDYLQRPVRMSVETINDICRFLKNGVEDLSAKRVNVVLHGGEPLMMKKKRFAFLCDALHREIGCVAQLQIGIQTNAILIDEDWIELFEKYKIDVGISLDGPEQVNDLYRVDKKGKGTHARTMAGIKQLQAAYNEKRIRKPGVVCVINPQASAKQVYRHIVSELGFTHMSFNLPMETVDSIPIGMDEGLAIYLSDLFQEWIVDDDPEVSIRLFDQMLRFFSGDKILQQRLPNYATSHVMVVIAGDGELSEHDDFKVINFAQRAGNVRDTSLLEFANSPLREYLHHVANTLPDDCAACDWKNYCRGGVTHGVTISRYSKERGFNNRSSLCRGFSSLFEAGARMMIEQGLPIETLKAALTSGQSEQNKVLKPIPADLFS